MNHARRKRPQHNASHADLANAAAVRQDLAAYDRQQLDRDDDSNQFAEEVFDEYQQMRAEVERSACRADREGW